MNYHTIKTAERPDDIRLTKYTLQYLVSSTSAKDLRKNSGIIRVDVYSFEKQESAEEKKSKKYTCLFISNTNFAIEAILMQNICAQSTKKSEINWKQHSTRQNHLQPHLFLLMNNETCQRIAYAHMRLYEIENWKANWWFLYFWFLRFRCWRYRTHIRWRMNLLKFLRGTRVDHSTTEPNRTEERKRTKWIRTIQNLNTFTKRTHETDKYTSIVIAHDLRKGFVLDFGRFIYFVFS